MEQMLLFTFTETRPGKARVMKAKRKEMVTEQQMSEYLDIAMTELLQPREEAVQNILRLARGN